MKWCSGPETQSSVHPALSVSLTQRVFHFYCQLYTVYSALLILQFPFLSLLLQSCPRLITSATLAAEPGELRWIRPTWFIFYCLVFNTFFEKSSPKKKLFQVSVSAKDWRRIPSASPQFGRRQGGSLGEATEVGRRRMCLFVKCVLTWRCSDVLSGLNVTFCRVLQGFSPTVTPDGRSGSENKWRGWRMRCQ